MSHRCSVPARVDDTLGAKQQPREAQTLKHTKSLSPGRAPPPPASGRQRQPQGRAEPTGNHVSTATQMSPRGPAGLGGSAPQPQGEALASNMLSAALFCEEDLGNNVGLQRATHGLGRGLSKPPCSGPYGKPDLEQRSAGIRVPLLCGGLSVCLSPQDRGLNLSAFPSSLSIPIASHSFSR